MFVASDIPSKGGHRKLNNLLIVDQQSSLAKVTSHPGTSGISSSIFNLGKTILGAGVLSLPSGIAAFTDSVNGIIPALGALIVVGVVSAYSFNSIGKTCERFGARSFSEAWSKSVDQRTGFMLNVIVVFNTFLSCLTYSIIIGDSFSQIFEAWGWHAFFFWRSNVIIFLTIFLLFPLSSFKHLNVLKYTSILGLLGTMYCALFMIIRYWDNSYSNTGRFYRDLAAHFRPVFDTKQVTLSEMLNSNIFMLISMISTSYVAHYNAPKFWNELQYPTTQRYTWVVVAGFSLAIVSYVIIMSMGYLTFGGNSSGFILNNYSKNDSLAMGARLAVGIGIICSYPFTFSALRDGIAEVIGISEEAKNRVYFHYINLMLFIVITSLTTRLRSVGTIVSFSGCLIGSLFIYVIPAIMNISSYYKLKLMDEDRQVSSTTWLDRVELFGNYCMAFGGVLIGLAGVMVNINAL